MIFFQDDRFFNTFYREEELEPVTYENLGVINYNSLYIANQQGDEIPLMFDNETKRYIDIRYEHFQVDWNLAEGQENFDMNRTYYKAVQCDKSHFQDNSENSQLVQNNNGSKFIPYFDEWEGYSLICMEKNGSKVKLQGDYTSWVMQTLKF